MAVHVEVGPFRVAQRGPKRASPIVAPTKRQVNRVKMALAIVESDVDLDALIPLGNEVLFGWVDYLPGTHERAAGYTVSRTRTLIRDGLNDAGDLSAEATVYTILHEGPLGHLSLAQVPPDDAWQSSVLALLEGAPLPAYTDPDQVWKQAPGDAILAKKLRTIPYWLRPYEGIIDSVVAACANGLDASWSKKYKRYIRSADKLEALETLWKGPRRAVPEELPPEPPVAVTEPPITVPLPEPPNPCQ